MNTEFSVKISWNGKKKKQPVRCNIFNYAYYYYTGNYYRLGARTRARSKRMVPIFDVFRAFFVGERLRMRNTGTHSIMRAVRRENEKLKKRKKKS